MQLRAVGRGWIPGKNRKDKREDEKSFHGCLVSGKGVRLATTKEPSIHVGRWAGQLARLEYLDVT